jgi:replicative DNA helicase
MTREWLPERLPEDIDAERSFLATCCAPGAGPGAAEAVAALSDDDFVHPAYRALFRALRALLSDGTEVSSLTLKDVLDQRGDLGRVGGYPGLVEILAGEDVERPAVLGDVIRRKATLRRLVHIGAKLVRQAAAEDEPPAALIEAASAELVDLAQAKSRKGLKPISEVSELALERIQEVADGRRAPGISTGLPRLDYLLGGGFKPGELIILAARPGVGKTTLAMEWCRLTADRHGTSALFSLEMSETELWNRMAANAAGISAGKLQTGDMTGYEWGKLKGARDALMQLPLLVNDQAEISVPEIRGQVDRAITRYGGLGLVVVDYLQLISSARGSQAAKQSEAVRIGEISRGLKLLAKDRGVPLVVLSQLNREADKRQGGRPQLIDLRDSGAIEQDADVVIFLHRKILAGDDPDPHAELLLAKQRNGPQGVVHLESDLQHFRFRERTREVASIHPAPAQRELL